MYRSGRASDRQIEVNQQTGAARMRKKAKESKAAEIVENKEKARERAAAAAANTNSVVSKWGRNAK